MHIKSLITTCCLLSSIGGFAKTGEVSFVTTPDIQSVNTNYQGNRAPLAPTAFIKLPLGSIQPQGWINELLVRQRDGLAGNLGAISAWLQKEGNAWLSDGGQFGWEEVPYWLRGYADMAFILNDAQLKKETMIWIEGIFRGQREDGWFGPVIEHDKGRDYWSNMLVLFTLQNYYEATNDKRVIELMLKYFKYELSVPDDKFIASYWEHSRGGDNLYSVYWLYNITGEKWLLELATKIDRCTANWRQKDALPNWHNVNVAQCFREPATYYMQSKDSLDLWASYHNFNLIRKIYGQAPGGMFASDENCRVGYDDPRQGTETCGFAEQMTSDGIMTRITGDVMWADNCEDIMFNSFPAAFTPDMKALHYITSPNMVLCDAANHSPGIDNSGPFLMMNPFSSRCCQHNHAHAVPYYIGNMFMATNDNGLLANLYGSARVTAAVANGTKVTISEQSNYPFEEAVTFTLNTQKRVEFPLYLRIPAWCNAPKIAINGRQSKVVAASGGYIKIDRTWRNGDKIELTLPMDLTLRKWERNKNSVSVNYGPITFSLAIAENYIPKSSVETAISDSKWQAGADVENWPSYEIHPASDWNFGLIVDEQHLHNSFTVEKRAYPKDNYPFTNALAPIVIKAKGRQIPSWQIDQYGLCGILPQSPVKTDASVKELLLVPMGGARLRISAFPTTN